MDALLRLYQDQLVIFLMVLIRISGLIMVAPLYNMRNAPVRVRALLAIGISLVVAPVHWHDPIEMPESLVQLAARGAQEAVLGLAIGLSVLILFSALQLTGQVVGQMSGLQLADVISPDLDTTVPIFTQLLDLIALAIFVTIGGHRYLMEALLESFTWQPPGNARFATEIVEAMVSVMKRSFVIGIRLSAPIMVSLFLSVIILGLVSRTLPQLNVLAVGFSLNSMVMMAALASSLGALGWLFQDDTVRAVELLRAAFTSGQ